MEQGGYTELNQRLVRTSNMTRHTMKPSQASVDALHAIQETPWVINPQALAFVDWLMGEGSGTPMALGDRPERPVRLSKAEYQELMPQQRRALAYDLRQYESSVAKYDATLDRLAEAARLAGREFYQPQFMDFRGRLYPHNVVFNNQGDHWCKGLLMFRDGSPLGEHGLRALMIHTANCWGQDKLQHDQRIAWCESSMAMLRSVAGSFSDASELLVRADEPLAAYAATVDLIAAIDAPVASEYVSRIPCAVDGTCNGLQILSLIGHDAVGGQKTNCTSDPVRQDVYQEVGDIALGLVEADLTNQDEIVLTVDDTDHTFEVNELASIWYEFIKDAGSRRKAVKRAIMTTAYGVSNNTIKNNLVDDGFVQKLKVPTGFDVIPSAQLNYALASYFRDVILEARSGAIKAAVDIMDYLKDVAVALGREGHAMEWTTPDGSTHRQDYRKMEDCRILTGEVGMMRFKRMTSEVDPRKQGSAAAPNVVHSLDAAMLRITAKRMADAGVTELSMIHDSYGASAGNIHLLGQVLRQVAVEIFSDNWLDGFHAEQSKHGVELPKPPALGTLDVAAELPAAEYFFS